MARKLRVEYEGAIYHVLNRGDRREPIFKDDADRRCFLATLGEACAKTGWQVHALCLMGNHFHLVVETLQPNLVAGMKWFLGTYTGRFNRRHKVFGHLFSGRYKALVVDGSGTGYLKRVCDYVHLNPVRARLLKPEQPVRAYVWSSWREYLKRPGQRWPWLRVDRLLGEYGIPQDSVSGRRHLEAQVEGRRAAEGETDHRSIRRGWCLGNEGFRKELLAQMAERVGPEHYGEERRESEREKAERLIAAGLKQARWTEGRMEQERKGHPVKVRLGLQLRKQTTLTVAEIAERLHLGTRSYAVQLLWRAGQRPRDGRKVFKVKN
jgi:putative transposase